jgi:hypothetical protein
MLFREVNEAIYRRASESGQTNAELEILCECEQRRCSEPIRITVERYDAVRRFPARFVRKHGELASDDERVVERYDEFFVVEKSGPVAQSAIRLDPRGRRGVGDRESAG